MNDVEKAFGVRPKTGYEFRDIDVKVMDSPEFKGLNIAWSATGMGFGNVTIAWGMGEKIKNEWPKQYGFHCSTECMSEEFVKALVIAAAPKIATLIMSSER